MGSKLIARPPAGGSSLPEVPLSSGQARTFLQARLALYGKVVGLLSLGFYVIANVTAPLFHDHGLAHLLMPGNVVHISAASIHLALWLACRRGAWSVTALVGMDALATIGAVGTYASMALVQPRPGSELVIQLCAMSVLLARAVLVPSSVTRTAWIGGASAAPAVAFPLAMGVTAMSDHLLETGVYLACWAAVAVVLSIVATRVIFGLRERVRAAQQLGQYTLLERIGAGGMGEVYRAEHEMLRRPTAIKLLRPEAVGEQALRRFEREVTLTARLTHPNTIAIYDYGRTADGVFYYAMEYLEGTDLEDLVAEHGPQPAERVAHILAQACDSLAEAHEAGLVHRDIKPANLFLCRRGRRDDVIKVLDFGLVKDLERNSDGSLTHVNAIAGTPMYMSPEAISHPDRVDARADLYALGAVGWFLLVGRPVFAGRTIVEVCAGHLHREPQRPSEASGRPVPRDLEEILLTCLAKDPRERFFDADDLRAALDATGLARSWRPPAARDTAA